MVSQPRQPELQPSPSPEPPNEMAPMTPSTRYTKAATMIAMPMILLYDVYAWGPPPSRQDENNDLAGAAGDLCSEDSLAQLGAN